MDDDWGFMLTALVSAVGFVTVIEPALLFVRLVYAFAFLLLVILSGYGAWTYDD